jgi:hypothetical protein
MIERECLMMDKLDQIISEMHKMNLSVTEIKTKLEYTEKLIDAKIQSHDERLDKVEDSQVWGIRLIIGTALTSLVALILAIIKFTGGL